MRHRLLLWLVLVVAPIAIAGWIVVRTVETRMGERIESDLTNVARLEAARITDAIEAYRDDSASLANGRHVREFVAGVDAVRSGRAPAGTPVGGVAGFAPVDPNVRRPLTELAEALAAKARTAGSEVVALRLVGRDGAVLGQAGDFRWRPYDQRIVARAMRARTPQFGSAYEPPGAQPRFGMVTPIFDASDRSVGALVTESRLAPIVDGVVEHEGFGDTSEAHVAQADAAGNAELITPLRFEPSAAFSKVVSASKDLPITRSLASPQLTVVRAPDYRSEMSILAIQTLPEVNWGLVVKIDEAEAMGPVDAVTRTVAVGALAAAAAIIAGWLVLVLPLGRRARRAAHAAEQVAGGDYAVRLDDDSGDEIGELSRTINRLAAELDRDTRKRHIVEADLRHRASHDELTGLHNRQHATVLIERLFAESDEPTSVLFLDLDGFKQVNDEHGHAVGDEALVAVGRRLQRAVDRGATVARWGGDEFVVVLPSCTDRRAGEVAERVREAFMEPLSTSVGLQALTCSVGVATSSSARSVDHLLAEADARMFAEKASDVGGTAMAPSSGRGRVARALADGRIETWYQPIFEVVPGRSAALAGVEALARLRELDGEMVLPGEFLRWIAGTPYSVALDRRVTSRALADLSDWRQRGLVGRDFRLTLNLGRDAVHEYGFAREIRAEVETLDLDTNLLVVDTPGDAAGFDGGRFDRMGSPGDIEVLEGEEGPDDDVDRIQAVKLDRFWLAERLSELDKSERSALTRIVGACDARRVPVIAEGVEDEAQVAALQGLGIRYFQGFHFAAPQPAGDLERDWLGAVVSRELR